MTTAANLDSRKSGMAYDDLPVLFQDVINVADRLDIEFLWIDRLCIIQGDDGDFQTQAACMGQIYGNATLTIAAVSAATERDAFVVKEQTTAMVNIKLPGIGKLNIEARERPYRLGTEEQGGDYGRMSTRAWIWQERLLAARTVFFTTTSVKFECRCYSKWEGDDHTTRGHSWSAQLDDMTHEKWTTLIEEFTKRKISRPYDRLPAIKAVMERIQKTTAWTPCFGLWTDDLIRGLCWVREHSVNIYGFLCKVNPRTYAPSWSWASVEGPISHAMVQCFGRERPKMIWDAHCVALPNASGMIRLSARARYLKLYSGRRVRPKRKETKIRPGGTPWYYALSGPDGPHANCPEINPDVVLGSRTVCVDGETVSTVMRVPYGEAAPTQHWETFCLCVLLYTDRSAVSLILGRCPEHPTAWERVGMCELPPSVFEGLERNFVDIY